MKNKRYLSILALLTTLFLIGGCGSSSSSDSTEETSVGADESAGATVSAVFSDIGGDSSINEASLPEKILDMILMVKTAVAQQSFTACDAVSMGGGPTGITMSTSGTNDTYGNSAEPLVVDGSTVAFCDDGGEVAAWNISTAIEMPCTDASNNSFTASMIGDGVFVEGTSFTDIFGDFTVTIGSDSATVHCTFHIAYDTNAIDFSDNTCELDGGSLATQNPDISCEPPSE